MKDTQDTKPITQGDISVFESEMKKQNPFHMVSGSFKWMYQGEALKD